MEREVGLRPLWMEVDLGVDTPLVHTSLRNCTNEVSATVRFGPARQTAGGGPAVPLVFEIVLLFVVT